MYLPIGVDFSFGTENKMNVSHIEE